MVDLQQLSDELYSLTPGEFVAARAAVVAAARAAGDKATATALAALRKPTVGAWLCNQLVRRDADTVRAAIDIGDELRGATAVGDREALRRLTRRRTELVIGLVAVARTVAAESEHAMTAETQREVEAMLAAAAVDPSAAAQLLTGRLTSPLSFEGFGFDMGAVPPPRHTPAPTRRTKTAGSTPTTAPKPAKGSGNAAATDRAAGARADAAAERARAAQEARRRQAIEEAEQALAVARLQEADAEAELAEAERVLEESTRTEAEAAAAYEQAQSDLADARADVRDARKDAAAAARSVVTALTRLEKATRRPG